MRLHVILLCYAILSIYNVTAYTGTVQIYAMYVVMQVVAIQKYTLSSQMMF